LDALQGAAQVVAQHAKKEIARLLYLGSKKLDDSASA
jgi:hypothetical protein